jgi:integrase
MGYEVSFFNSDRIRRICKGAQKVHSIQPRPLRKHMTLDILEKIIKLCDTNSYDDICIRTALCVGFAGFLRTQDFTYSSWKLADQASKPTRASVKFFNNCATLELPITKTDQLRRGTIITLAPTNRQSCPIANLQLLFTRFPAPPNAPLFGRGHPTAASLGIYFTPSYFTNAFQQLLLRTGIDPTGFTGHSIRRGAAQSAADIGMDMMDIQTLGRWKSDAMLRYVSPATAIQLKENAKSNTKLNNAPRYRKR